MDVKCLVTPGIYHHSLNSSDFKHKHILWPKSFLVHLKHIVQGKNRVSSLFSKLNFSVGHSLGCHQEKKKVSG